ncbi:Metallo-hydrolase/oxidoreductase [Xylariomycetidae sp. FL0641]|nr:Metallo-hydrolase/oxidoreductase [Xylariomycetidae sp. FL0641]
MSTMRHLHLDPSKRKPLLKDQKSLEEVPASLPVGKVHTDPRGSGSDEDASIYFIGTATTVLEWRGARLLTDPNFLHAGDHVHLGPEVTAQRRTNPAVDLHALPAPDGILLSHYHEDHFDRLVEDRLRRDVDIVTTPHAKACLAGPGKEDPFRAVHDLDPFQSLALHIDDDAGGKQRESVGGGYAKAPVIKVTATPGKHVPPGPLAAANDLLKAVPPTNGWLLELGTTFKAPTGAASESMDTGYRIYISGDTLFVDELREIPKRLQNDKIDLMLVHLGGTTIPGPSMPLVMVTMDAEQGLQLMQLVNPDVTIPIHYDDYSVFMSPLSDFQEKVDGAGWKDRVVYLDRGEQYRFKVRET